MKHTIIGMSAVAGIVCLPLSAAVATFESVTLAPENHWNGADMTGTLSPVSLYGEQTYVQDRQIEGSGFRNNFTDWGFGSSSWSGFAVSNHTDTATATLDNQYSSFAGSGAGGSANYAVGFYATYEDSTNVTLGSLTNLAGKGASFTNTTYTALDMTHGASFGKKFGGATGNDADWLKLTVSGFAGGSATGTSIDFFLADFRFANNAQDYILDDWAYMDFTPLGTVDELRFTMSSSDNGTYGMNTPSYFAMDNFLAVPEPSSLLAAITGLSLFLRRKR